MEEIKTYIESGILELYASGGLNSAERLEVEAMLVKHPSLKAELDEIEKSLEQYAASYAVEPSAQLRQKVLGSLAFSESKHVAPEAGIINFAAPRQSAFFRYAFAASVALLLLSVVAIAVLYSRLQNTQQQLAVLQTSNQQFTNRVNYLNTEVDRQQMVLGVLRNPQYKMIRLAGTAQAPDASMVVAFNPAKKDVVIDLAALNMPENDADHQYQLWALVDGKPVDLGVFDKKDEDGMKKMKALENAQAFAVTLEPRGGSVSPTMEQMMVMGAI